MSQSTQYLRFLFGFEKPHNATQSYKHNSKNVESRYHACFRHWNTMCVCVYETWVKTSVVWLWLLLQWAAAEATRGPILQKQLYIYIIASLRNENVEGVESEISISGGRRRRGSNNGFLYIPNPSRHVK